jgi:hypothetical protein
VEMWQSARGEEGSCPVDKEDSVEFCYGPATARALSRQPLDEETPVHRQASLCENSVIHTGNETSFCSKYSLIHVITNAIQNATFGA